MALYAAVMFTLNWRLALLTMIVLPPLAVASVYFRNAYSGPIVQCAA